jgi:superoxide dismutase, Fe-Mn family
MPYSLPDLPYDYSALEPHIDAKTMEIHHTKHHQTYVDKLNAAIEGTGLDQKYSNVDDLVANINEVSDETTKKMVRNHGGGHSNHSLFWTVMSSDGGGDSSGSIAEAIDSSFGSFKEFRDKFTTTATNHFGSGWAWLVSDGGKLDVIGLPNQDSPFMEGKTPLLGIDVWEHAYYLKYQNKRPDYIEAWWNTVSWDAVSKRYDGAK